MTHDEVAVAIPFVAAVEGDADVGGDRQRRIEVLERQGDGARQLLGAGEGLVGIGDPGQEMEFVRSDPRHEVRGEDGRGQTIGEFDQHAVGDQVAVDLVERLETIDVDGHQGTDAAVVAPLGETAVQFGLESLAIGQAGQAVADLRRLGVALGFLLGQQDFGQFEAAAEGIGEDTDPGGDRGRHQAGDQRASGRLEEGGDAMQDAEPVIEEEQHSDDAEEDDPLTGCREGPSPGRSECCG